MKITLRLAAMYNLIWGAMGKFCFEFFHIFLIWLGMEPFKNSPYVWQGIRNVNWCIWFGLYWGRHTTQ